MMEFGDWGITQDADTAVMSVPQTPDSNVIDIATGQPVAAPAAATPQSESDQVIGRIRAILSQLTISDEELRRAKSIIERMLEALKRSGIKDTAAERALKNVIQKHVNLANAQVRLNSWINELQDALGMLSPANEMGFAPAVLWGGGLIGVLGTALYTVGGLRRQTVTQAKELELKERAYNDALAGKVPWSVWSMIGVEGGDWKTALVKILPFVAVGGGAYYIWNRLIK